MNATMNRFATALYPSIPSSGSEGSSTNATPQDSARGESPIQASLAVYTSAGAPPTSIYNDPRRIRFPPAALMERGGRGGTQASSSNLTVAANTPATQPTPTIPAPHTPQRPDLLRRVTDEAVKKNINGVVNLSSGGGADHHHHHGHHVHPPDRSLRVNLMAVPPPKNKGRASVPQTCGGRLTSMAKGPNGRYVVGGGQYLRVLEISSSTSASAGEDPVLNPPSPKSIRQAGSPFARGPGGSTISEVVNFWKGSWAIGKGVNDVDWGVATMENKIVTATPSGNFMVFDVNRGKVERETSGGHTRPMNCIRFSRVANYSHLLITGGTEGHCRLWDLRDGEPVNRKFYKHNAPVSALAFCPDDAHYFVVGTEAGGLFRYDYRVPSKPVGKVWGAHGSKAVLDLKWKEPGDDHGTIGLGKGWLASAGSDRTVQIWDMGHTWDKGASPTHLLHTAYQIRCVDWRPSHATELAVVPFDQPIVMSADVNRPIDPSTIPDDSDSALEVWDVRRHYVAKYALPGIDGNAVTAIWDDSDSLVACYQKGELVQVDLNSKVSPKTYPLDTIPRQITAWSARGEMAYAIDHFRPGEIPFDDIKPEFATWHVGGRQRKGVADPAYEPLQTVGTLPLPDDDDAEFIYVANQYRFEGDSAEMLCRWNREVAVVCGRVDEARVWDCLQSIVEEFGAQTSTMFNEGVFSLPAVSAPAVHVSSPTRLDEQGDQSGATSLFGRNVGIPLRQADEAIVAAPDLMGSSRSDDDSDSSSRSSVADEPTTPPKSRFKAFVPPETTHAPVIRAEISRNDSSMSSVPYTFLGTRVKKLVFDTGTAANSPSPMLNDMDYPDPYGIAAALESAALREKSFRGGLSSRTTPHSSRPSTPKLIALSRARGGSPTHSPAGSQRPSITAATKDLIQPSRLVRRAQESFAPEQWDEYRVSRCRTLLDWWQSYVDDGEVQLATAIFIVGAPVVDFPPKQAERVLEAYIDRLERYGLSVPAAYVRRFTSVPSAQTLATQDGITHLLYCGRCGKSTGSLDDMDSKRRKFWWCKACRRAAKICAVCREPAKGLWQGCTKCRHGGHPGCMMMYYDKTYQSTTQADAAAASTISAAAGGGAITGLPTASRTSSPAPAPGLHRRHSAGLHGTSLESGLSERTERHTTTTEQGGADSVGGGGAHGGAAVVTTNMCPTGCGCQCRKTRGVVDGGGGGWEEQ